MRCVVLLILHLIVSADYAQGNLSAGNSSQNQVRFRHLQNAQGLMSGQAWSMAQDSLGYIWVGTSIGLYRYDGYEFKSYFNNQDDSSSIAHNSISCLYTDSKGILWVGMLDNGVDQYDHLTDRFIHHPYVYSDSLRKSNKRVNFIGQDWKGRLITWGESGHSAYYNEVNGRFEPYHPWSETPTSTLRQQSLSIILYTDSHNRIWYLSRKSDHLELMLYDPQSDTAKLILEKVSWVNSVIEHPDSVFWIGTWGSGLARFDEKNNKTRWFKHNADDPTSIPSDIVRNFATDKESNLWIATTDGLALMRPEKQGIFESFKHNPSDESSLAMDYLEGVMTDREGGLWVSNNAVGLDYYHPISSVYHWLPYGLQKGFYLGGRLPEHFVEDFQGRIWILHGEGVDRYDPLNGKVLHLKHKADDPHSIHANMCGRIGIDGNGRIWVQHFPKGVSNIDAKSGSAETRDYVGRGIGFLNFFVDNGHRTWVSTYRGVYQYDPLLDSLIDTGDSLLNSLDGREFTQDKKGNIWVGTWDQGVVRFDPKTKRSFQYLPGESDKRSLAGRHSHILYADNYGVVWIVTDNAINRYDAGTDDFTRFYARDGFPIHMAQDLGGDEQGNLWFTTSRGICRWEPTADKWRFFDSRDGLPRSQMLPLLFGSDGTLYAGAEDGVIFFNPARIKDAPLSDGISFTAFKKIGKNGAVEIPGISQLQSIGLNHRDNYIEIGFSAMSFADFGRITYEYKMQGMADEWIDIGERRLITFMDPSPGDYVLHVRARNGDGKTGDKEVRLKILVHPPWWQTTWAYIVYGLMLILASVTYTRWRTRILRSRKIALEKTVQDRTAEIFKQKDEIEKEKDRSEELLLNILPSEVAEELKEYGKAEARDFDSVSILFTDFKGFTKIAGELPARLLVAEIDTCFRAFDRIITHYGLEKIKTIGDAYMAAGGLPDPQAGPPINVIRAGLEMQEFMGERKRQLEASELPAFDMRLGIHTGPVIAGIVGIKKFQYDIWGDTVNIASRMESAGEIGLVNISQKTYDLVKNQAEIAFIYRGEVEVKGKGALKMYFAGRRPDS